MHQSYDNLPLPDLQQLSPAQRHAVQEVLQPDETLIWLGRPSGRIVCPPFPLLMIMSVFFILPLLFAVSQINRMYWYGMNTGSDVVTLIYCMFCLMISLFTVTQPWRVSRLLGKYVYILTDQRVVSLMIHRRQIDCQKLHYANIETTQIQKHGSGYPMLAIEPVEKNRHRDFPVLKFMDIPDPTQVQQLIKDYVKTQRMADGHDV